MGPGDGHEDRPDLMPQIGERVEGGGPRQGADVLGVIDGGRRQQASALERIQTTLGILVKHLAPKLEGQLPAAVRVVGDGEAPDLASALVIADPIGAGFTMNQAEVAKAVGITQADASVLLRAFQMNKDGTCAVIVRPGGDKKREVVNYHPRTLDRFREILSKPPGGLDANQKSSLKRARAKLGINT
jgi:hypothetical protein